MPPKRRKRGATARKNQIKKEDDPLTEAKKKQLEINLAEYDAKCENFITSVKNDLITSCRNIQAFYDMQLLAIPSHFHDLTTSQYIEMKKKCDQDLKESAEAGISNIVDISSVLTRIENCRVASSRKKKNVKRAVSETKTQKSLARISESRNMTGVRTRRALAQMQERVAPTSKKHGLPSNTTPCRKNAAVNATPSVTPKFDLRKPLLPSALRKPRAGEIVMSLSGSPLLNTAGAESKSGVLLQLGCGKVIDISDISRLNNLDVDFDPSTKRTLKLVNRKLAKILGSS